MFPLKKELMLFLDSLKQMGVHFEQFQDQGYWYYLIKELNLTCAIGGHGKVQFALQTQKCLLFLKDISHVFCLGAAGALSPNLNIADVVYADSIIEHDYHLKFISAPAMVHLSDPVFFKGFNKKISSFQLIKGVIASGDEDIIDAQRAEELYQKTKAIAVAWEGAGGARAAQFHSLTFTELRAITDNARSNVSHDFNNNLPTAMKNLTEVLVQLLVDPSLRSG